MMGVQSRRRGERDGGSMRARGLQFLELAGLVLSMLIFLRPAGANEWVIESNSSVRTEINDNYRLSTQPHNTVTVLQAGAGLSAQRNTETSSVSLNTAFSGYTVRGEDSPSQTNGSLDLDYSLLDVNERYNLNVKFLRDSTFESELSTTGVALRRGQRNLYSVASSWGHAFSERWNGQVQLLASKTKYAERTIGSGTDYRYAVASGSLSHILTERDRLDLQLSHSDYRTEADRILSRTNDLSLSWRHDFSETANGSLSYGRYRSHTAATQQFLVCALPAIFCQLGFTNFDLVTVRDDSSNTGSIFNASLQVKLNEVTDFSARASRQLAPSGSSSLLQTNASALSLSHALSPVLRGGVEYSQSRANYIGNLGNLGNLATGSQPSYRSTGVSFSWRVQEYSNLDFGYRSTRSKNQQSGSSASANIFFAAFKYEWPRVSASR